MSIRTTRGDIAPPSRTQPDSAPVLPFSPPPILPIGLWVDRLRNAAGEPVTVIVRQWDDVGLAFCNRCPVCEAHHNVCMVRVAGHIAGPDLALYDFSVLEPAHAEIGGRG